MDRDSIDRIRSATFPISRRGYEKDEVDQFLVRVADWLETGGADETRAEVVRRELERVGEQTGKVLAEAHDAAERMRVQAERKAQEVTEEAEAKAAQVRAEADRVLAEAQAKAETDTQRIRTEADTYAAQTRTDASRDAEKEIATARAEAKRIVEEANVRKRDLESVIADLENRRGEVLAGLRRLSSELAGTATEHGRRRASAAGDGADQPTDGKGTPPAEAGDESDTRTMPAQKKETRARPAGERAGTRPTPASK